MIKIPFYKANGDKAEELTMNVSEKALNLNKALIAQALRVEENRISSSNGKTKTRGEVSGGGKKPWKQKGTGRARAGSSRSPIWRGGGVTFGPTGENRILNLPKKMKHLAFAQLFVRKIQMNDVCAIETFEIKDGKTKNALDVLHKISKNRKITVVASVEELGTLKPWQNIALAETIESTNIKLIDFMKNRQFVFSKKSVDEISKRLANV